MPQVAVAKVVANQMEKVQPKVALLFERDDTFYSQVGRRGVEKISSRDMRVPLEIRPGGKFGHFNSDGGDLGRGGGPTFDKAVVNTVDLKLAVEWTKKAEWSSDTRRKAVLRTFNHLLAKAMAEFRRHCDAMCMTAGNGVLGTISAVSNAGGVDTYTLDSDGFGARLVRHGIDINVYNSALTTHRTSGGEKEITFWDVANKQIKCSEVTGAVATDKIVVSGLSGASPTSIFGVPYHHSNASTGTWLGLDRATNPEIRANRVNAAGALALPFARLAMNKVGDRVGRDKKKACVAWMHPSQKQAYEQLGQQVNIINKEAKEQGLDLYFGDQMQMAGAPVKEHFNWDRTRIDFVAKEVWGRAEMHPAKFYDVDGTRIFEIRGTTGGVATAQVFYLVVSHQFFVNNPAQCAYIDGLTVPTGY